MNSKWPKKGKNYRSNTEGRCTYTPSQIGSPNSKLVPIDKHAFDVVLAKHNTESAKKIGVVWRERPVDHGECSSQDCLDIQFD